MAKKQDRSNRQLKLGENIRHALANLFLRGTFLHPDSDKEINILIPEVRVSPDARNVTAFYLPMNGQLEEAEAEKLENILNDMQRQVQHELGKEIYMKYIPRIHFKRDVTIDNATRINDLLHEEEF